MTKKHNRINQQDLRSVIANAITNETLRIEALSHSQIDGVAGGATAVSVVGGILKNIKDLTTAGMKERPVVETSFDY